MSQDIESYIKQCRICEKFQRQNCKETLHSHDIPLRPFCKIGIDLCSFNDQQYLIVIDYFSKWIEIIPQRNKTIEEVIVNLKRLFNTFGVPTHIVCDNVPFRSFKFKQFSEEYDFELLYISAKYSQSNGMVEKAVHIAKTLLKKNSGGEIRYTYQAIRISKYPSFRYLIISCPINVESYFKN